MTSEQITTSAALYGSNKADKAIPLSWLERATEFFSEHRLVPVLFTAGGDDFELDDCFVLADSGGELFKWGEGIAARRDDLVNALGQGAIHDLALDSPRCGAKSRSDWRASASVFMANAQLYVGIDEELVSDPVDLLRREYEHANDLFDVGYGIAYKMPLAEEPDSYAVGSGPYSFADFREEMRLRREGIRRQKTVDELWRDELNGKRRHLNGLFRGAYPASILSESHVRAAELDSQRVGRLSQLDASLWIWELSESELPHAESLLAERKLLVSQAAES